MPKTVAQHKSNSTLITINIQVSRCYIRVSSIFRYERVTQTFILTMRSAILLCSK